MDMPELQAVMAYARRNWNQVALRATSIVAWFRMLAFRETPPQSKVSSFRLFWIWRS